MQVSEDGFRTRADRYRQALKAAIAAVVLAAGVASTSSQPATAAADPARLLAHTSIPVTIGATGDRSYAVFGVFDEGGRIWTMSSLRSSDGKVAELFTGAPTRQNFWVVDDEVTPRVIASTSAGVWSVPLDGGQPVALNGPLAPGTEVIDLSVSANGATVAFTTKTGAGLGAIEVWAGPVTGPPPVAPLGSTPYMNTQPALSADGRFVAFTSYTNDFAAQELFVAPVGGTATRIDGPVGSFKTLNYGNDFVYYKLTGPAFAGELRRGTFGSLSTVLIDAHPTDPSFTVSVDDPLSNVVVSGSGSSGRRVASISGAFAPWDILAPPFSTIDVDAFDGWLRIIRRTAASQFAHISTGPVTIARTALDGSSETVLTASPFGHYFDVGRSTSSGDYLYTEFASGPAEPHSLKFQPFAGGPPTVVRTSPTGAPTALIDSDDQRLFLALPRLAPEATLLHEATLTGENLTPVVELKGGPSYAETFGGWLLVLDSFHIGGRGTNELLLVKRNATPLSPVRSLVPARLMDTRGPGLTIDGLHSGIGVLRGASTIELPVAGRGGVASGAAAVVVNITSTAAEGDGYLTIFPCGQPRPNTSNLNFNRGETIANLVVAKVGVSGKVCIFTSAMTHLIADVSAFIPGASSFGSLVPSRLLDSRAPALPSMG